MMPLVVNGSVGVEATGATRMSEDMGDETQKEDRRTIAVLDAFLHLVIQQLLFKGPFQLNQIFRQAAAGRS